MKKSLQTAILALLCAASASAMPVDDVTLKYVSPQQGELDIELRSLSQITLTFDQDIEVAENKTATLALPNGETLTAPLVRNRFLGNTVTLNFPEILPLNGKYTLTIKRWSVGDAEWIANYEAGHSNPKIEVEWTVSNGLEAGVDYDLNPVSITPANNASIAYAATGSVKIVMPEGTIMNPNVAIHLSCTEAKYEQQLTFVATGSKNVTYTAEISPVPVVNGTYTLMIPGGSFGDADFIAGNGGHANPPISYQYSFSGNMSSDGELLSGVDYSEKPVSFGIAKSGNSYVATLKTVSDMAFNVAKTSSIQLLNQQAYAVDGVSFSLNASTAGEAEIGFTANLDADKRYTLLIPEGLFGNSIWVASNYAEGTANPQLRLDFTPSELISAVEAVVASAENQPNTVYTASGILIYRDATEAQISALAPGIYIIAGKKFFKF